MTQIIPHPEIVDDLLTENWLLRWQVLEIFDHVRVKYHNHNPGSKEKKAILRLGRKLCSSLNGPSDHNLYLILTAAFFLGGNYFPLLIFKHLGIDDADQFYPTVGKIKKDLINKQKGCTFFNYFFALLSSNDAVERTTAVAATITIRLFPPAQAFSLLISIPQPEPRRVALDLFQEIYPEIFFNDLLLTKPPTILAEQPELLSFIGPPLTADQTAACSDLITAKFNPIEADHKAAIAAIGRLKLKHCRELLSRHNLESSELNTTLAQIGEYSGCKKLLSAANSWRQSTRIAALPGLAYCNYLEAIKLLKKRYSKGSHKERDLIIAALGQNHHPQAYPALIEFLGQKAEPDERRAILKAISHHPDASPNPLIANLLAQWHRQKELYPELLEALEKIGHSDKWETITLDLPPQRLPPEQQQIAFFMARFCNQKTIRKKLFSLLNSVDWSFSFQLLNLLQPSLKADDMRFLLNLLQEVENARELTIQELLRQGDNPGNFHDALCEHLNLNLQQSHKLLSDFCARLVTGKLPSKTELTSQFQQQPSDLKKLISGATDFSSTEPEPSLPLLHFLQLLSETNLYDNFDSNSLISIINRTRKYKGYFRELISFSISRIIDNDPDLLKTEALPDLHAVIDFIRQRSDYNQLRHKILIHSARITRNAKDLAIHINAAQDRDLRIIKIKRASSNE